MLQAHGGARASLVERAQPCGRQLEQRRALAHPRARCVRHAFQDREVANQLARAGERHAPLELAVARQHFHRAANDDEGACGRIAGGEEPRAARQLQRAADRYQLVDLVSRETFEQVQQRQERAPVEARRGGRREIDARGRLAARRAVFLRRMSAHLGVQRAQLVREHPRYLALQGKRRSVAARDHGAKVVPLDEPGGHPDLRAHARRAGATLDERHLAEHVPRTELGDGKHAAAGQHDLRLYRPGSDQEGAARGLALPHKPRALRKGELARDRQELVKRQCRISAIPRWCEA